MMKYSFHAHSRKFLNHSLSRRKVLVAHGCGTGGEVVGGAVLIDLDQGHRCSDPPNDDPSVALQVELLLVTGKEKDILLTNSTIGEFHIFY